MNNTLPKHLIPYIAVGAQTRQTFQDIVSDFYDDFDTHLYLRGQAGVGKTREVTLQAQQRNILLCHFEGNVTRWAMMKKIAVYLYNAGWPSADKIEGIDFDAEDLPKVVVYCDDVATLFEKDFIDTMKIALEEESSDKLVYGSSLGGQYKSAEPFEREAIDHFRTLTDPGFTMRFYGRVKFIFTMNHALATDLDVEQAKKTNKSLKMINDLEDRYALFSRIKYQDLYMSKNEYWGWIADLVINHNILPTATDTDKAELLVWLYDNWEKLKDKSVRMVKQKLWKDMEKAKNRPTHDYKSRWYQLVKQAA